MSKKPLMTPPNTPPPEAALEEQINPSQDPESLASRLDELLEVYLNHLDAYTALRIKVSQSCASGFLSLAHANRVSTTGRRYGEEGYDKRMKALRRVKIERKTRTELQDVEKTFDRSRIITEVTKEEQEDQKQKEGHAGNTDQDPDTVNFASLLEFKVITSPGSIDSTLSSNSKSCTDSSSNSSPPCDPLKWYGILTPQYLRQAQTQFTRVVESFIPDLCYRMKRMHELEGEIRDLRKLIDPDEDTAQSSKQIESKGNSHLDEGEKDERKAKTYPETLNGVHVKVTSDAASSKKSATVCDTSASSSPSSRSHVLVSRPLEPRPRILKVD